VAVVLPGVDAVLTSPTPGVVANRPSVALSAERVASVLVVDAATGAASAARAGDHVDVLGYFSRQSIGPESVTRVLLQDVPVLTVDRSGASVALTLEVPHDGALLLQEAQAIGARPFVALRSAQSVSDAQAAPGSFSDTDLARRLAGGG
jgi:Flp pilus assembly protein CpaB